jgi:hypothetical protein
MDSLTKDNIYSSTVISHIDGYKKSGQWPLFYISVSYPNVYLRPALMLLRIRACLSNLPTTISLTVRPS